jgi:dihydroflavonol-4-reductase
MKQKQIMKALVIGADGLLGSTLVRQLLDDGVSVGAGIQPGSTSPTLEGLSVERVALDLLDPGPAVSDAARGCDVVFHCAAITDLWASADLTWKVNVDGTQRVIDACLERGVRRLVFVGSASSFAFGSQEEPGDEEGGFPEAYQGVSYMESKAEATRRVLSAVRDRGLDAVVVAPTFMLGEFDSRPSSGELIRQFLLRRMRCVSSGGRNFAHASDVARAMISAAERGRRGRVYLLAGTNLTYLEFFTRVARIAGIDPPTWTLPGIVVKGTGALGSVVSAATGMRVPLGWTTARLSLGGTYYSPARAIRELNMPQTPIERGIEDTLRGLRRYGHLADLSEEPFAGKVALVTGASRGVGLATARALVLRGAKVVLSARGQGRLVDSAERLRRIGGEVEAVAGDVGRWEDAQRMVEVACERFGGLDILVNNAGVSMRGRFGDLSAEVCKQTIDSNLLGAVYVSRAALEPIVKARGHIVFVSSIAGIMGLPGASTYCASKAALTGLCESLRLELGPQGVHVGVAHLGFTEHDPEKRVLAADGSWTLPDRPAHHTQAQAAEQILGLIRERDRRRVLTPTGKLGGAAYRLSPALVEWAVASAQTSQWGVFKRFS